MFPIHDARGRVVAFGGRAMSADVAAKYLNSPETPLFHKGALLFNHHNARKAAHDTGQVIVVEGYVDVIAMTLAGFPQVVAPLGTALTEDQLALLWRMAGEPVICLDGDKAGRKAAGRAIDLALPLLEPGRSLAFALLPEGQDPDDLARSGGKPAIAEVIGAARPLVDMLWAREFEASQLDTPERRAAFERRLREPLGQIRDEATRRHYRREIDERLGQLFAPPQQERFEGGARAGSAAVRGAGAAPGAAASGRRFRWCGRARSSPARRCCSAGMARTRARPSSCWRWRAIPTSSCAASTRSPSSRSTGRRRSASARRCSMRRSTAASTRRRSGAGWSRRASPRRRRHCSPSPSRPSG